MKVPFFNYPWVYKQHEEEVKNAMLDVMNRGAFILQSDLEDFEKNISDFIGAKYVFGVADGTNALILALRAMGIGEGDEVILPSHTYIASAASIHYVGATPIPVECGEDHMLDYESVLGAITSKTKAIMPVQLNGRTCDMDKIGLVASENNLKIVEDSAQALGSKFKGKCAGTFGSAGTFSFYPAKVLGGFGDGGAVVTNDEAIAEKLAFLRDHGRDKEGEVVAWGLNSRLDNLHAAVLNVKLKYYRKDIDRRREVASIYHEQLSGIASLKLPPAPDSDQNHFDIYQNYEILAEKRDALKAHLADQGVGSLVQFGGKAIHQHTELGFCGEGLPITESYYDRFLMIPMNTSISNEELDYVCSHIRNFYGAN